MERSGSSHRTEKPEIEKQRQECAQEDLRSKRLRSKRLRSRYQKQKIDRKETWRQELEEETKAEGEVTTSRAHEAEPKKPNSRGKQIAQKQKARRKKQET